jgi:hypothetical protein
MAVLQPASGGLAETSLSPLALMQGPTDLCLRLDSTKLMRAHFAADTPMEDGAASSFTLSLLAVDGGLLGDGWDVTVGGSPPRSSANLEWNPTAGQVQDVVLRVASKDTVPRSTSLSVSLMDPLE